MTFLSYCPLVIVSVTYPCLVIKFICFTAKGHYYGVRIISKVKLSLSQAGEAYSSVRY
jgi:hypothetical protein